MHALTWLALGCAALLVPTAGRARRRADALAVLGRLTATGRDGSPPARAIPAVVAYGAALLAAAGCAAVGGTAVGVAGAVTATTAVALIRSAGRRRAADRARSDLHAALNLLGAELSAGTTPAAALAAAAELAPGHRDGLLELAQRAQSAMPADEHEQPTDPALAALGHAWQLSAVTGASLARVCTQVAVDLGDRIDQRRAVTAALAGARSTAGLLAGLPLLGVALGAAMHAQPLAVLFATPPGRAMLVSGVCLDAAGLWWTHWLAARAEGP